MAAVEHVAGEIDQEGVQLCRRCNVVMCDAAEYGDMVTSDGAAPTPLFWPVGGAVVFDGPLKCQREHYRGPAAQCEEASR